MLSIYATTDLLDKINQIIDSENRLSELVKVFGNEELLTDTNYLLVNEQGIHWPIPWNDTIPPYLIPTYIFDPNHLLSAIFFRLGNYEKAWSFLDRGDVLLNHFSTFNLLSEAYPLSDDVISFVQNHQNYHSNSKYNAAHNEAVLRHYGRFTEPQSFALIKSLYENAIEMAPNPELSAFSIKHYSIFLLDNDQLEQAEMLLRNAASNTLSNDSQHALHSILTDVLLNKLVVPYDDFLLGELKSLIWTTLEYERKKGNKVREGLRLLDASQISLVGKSYSESLGYLNKAVDIFEMEEYPEFIGEAMRRKGGLLYSWAQDGNPQFFKSALESYQSALKTFTKEVAPSIFADIHHNLAIIYAELPTEPKKKGLMASIALTSFQQALDYYTKETFPYEFATICTHYGNALCKFPPTINSDNFEKALFYYAEALEIRTSKYPVERALTLLNYLEASWNVKEGDTFNESRYNDMKSKAKEVLSLVTDETIRAAAQNHLDNLEKLKMLEQNS